MGSESSFHKTFELNTVMLVCFEMRIGRDNAIKSFFRNSSGD